MPDTSSPDVASTAADQDVQRSAFARMRSKIESIPQAEVLHVNVDVTYAAGVGVWAAGRVAQLRGDMEQLSAFVDLAAIDELPDRAHALSYTHGDYLFAVAPQAPVAEQHDESQKLISLLLLSASALSAQGLLPNERVELVRTPTGYRNASEHLTALTKLFKDYWPTIESKTGVTMAQLDRGAVLAVQLLQGSIERIHAPLNPTDATLARQRAYTLFFRAYDEARRAVTFLRWRDKDVERFVPPLVLRAARGRKGEDDVEVVPAVPAAPSSPDAEAAIAASAPAGHRGGSPFVA
jgi:hypothetical protein